MMLQVRPKPVEIPKTTSVLIYLLFYRLKKIFLPENKYFLKNDKNLNLKKITVSLWKRNILILPTRACSMENTVDLYVH